MRTIVFLNITLLLIRVFLMAPHAHAKTQSAYSFTFEPLMDEELIKLEDYKGQVMMIVNTASKCGFTDQYEGLETLYNQYKDQGFVIIGVPSNDFGNQEPGTHEEIAQFCKINYGVSFPITAKYSVKGDNKHPFYVWAREELGFGTAPKWNFHKYLINKNGELVDYFHSTTKPQSQSVISAIETMLKD